MKFTVTSNELEPHPKACHQRWSPFSNYFLNITETQIKRGEKEYTPELTGFAFVDKEFTNKKQGTSCETYLWKPVAIIAVNAEIEFEGCEPIPVINCNPTENPFGFGWDLPEDVKSQLLGFGSILQK